MSPKLSGLTVFFPCFNDAGTISRLVAQADALAPQCSADYEILVVDDASTDGSQTVLRETQKVYPRLRLIFHPKNLGYGGALASGFKNAVKDYIFYTDGDGQYSLNDLQSLIGLMDSSTDIVNGYKTKRRDSQLRIALGVFYNTLAKRLLGIKLRDIDCDFRLMRRSIFEAIELTRKSGAVCAELIKKAESRGYRIAECPVNHYTRPVGTSSFFKPLSLWNTLKDFLGLYADSLSGRI